ncbi:hypothetical protein LWM68_34960 [Niabella sp. W65]|jgi:hypothetical protein|nr:hypothetical protein [Niabella sp. W65]MCH7367505.1 hypothetical protein [Niabella sp. W65]ULT43549.1 hypothetical protein KRR40_09030 [Niabella sp. I65]
MKRRQHILIGLIAAIVTFGSLYAVAGEQYFAKRHNGRFCNERYSRQMHAEDWYKDGERPVIKSEAVQ